jgi:hypothetical protein
MALRKNIDGIKYYYLIIKEAHYQKNNGVVMLCSLLVKEKEEFLYEEQKLNYATNMPPSSLHNIKPTNTSTIPALFSIENMNAEGTNIIKQCYLWLKENIYLLKDFEDC